jgi:ribonuclease J
MKLTIHRGTHEIGGSCLELVSDSEQTRIVVDVGLPLVNSDGSPFEWDKYKTLNTGQLLDEKILPRIQGLYEDGKPSVSAVLLSHAHLDHYGLFKFIHHDIPLYMSTGTMGLAEISNIFLGAGVRLERAKTFTMWQPFQIEEFTTTPYLVDHSAPDAAAFLIEGDGQRIFYTGDFRGHGRKGVLLDRITDNPPRGIDYLVMEGSMLGRSEGLYPDEAAVEQAIYDQISAQADLAFIFTSSQNLDRLISIFRAVKRSGKMLVIDLYTAFVLDKLGILSSSIPQFDWEGIRVLFSHYHAGKLAEQDKNLLYKYRRAKIDFEEIKQNPRNKVLLAKDSRYFRIMCSKLQPNTTASAIYSMWHGYLERSDLSQFLETKDIPITEIHTSGHAYVSQLKRLADALKPRFIIPIHTFYPEQYVNIFPNVIQLKDGEEKKLQ